jgi:hypothetical protein
MLAGDRPAKGQSCADVRSRAKGEWATFNVTFGVSGSRA